MQEFSVKLQQEVCCIKNKISQAYAETHPKSYIKVLIVQGMVNDPTADTKKQTILIA
jgi:hypothetical protein